MSLDTALSNLAARLSDDELLREFCCAERCALLSTRCRRDVALLRMRCICRELARRRGSDDVTPSVIHEWMNARGLSAAGKSDSPIPSAGIPR
jgi:hypothetical protein